MAKVEKREAVCSYCNRPVELMKTGGAVGVPVEWRFVKHNTKNGRNCYNSYGKPKDE